MNLTALNTAIYSRLAGGTALTSALGGTAIYYDTAPDGKALPYVICSIASRVDDNESPHRTQNILAYIRAYASTPVQANTIDSAVDDLMHNHPLTISGVTSNFWCMREDSFAGTEVDTSTRKVCFSGGQYRIRIDI
jgi:hypothetical protein